MTTKSRCRLNAGGPTDRFTSARQLGDFGGTGRRIDYFHFHYPDKDFSLYHPAHLSECNMGGKQKQLVRIENAADRWRFTCPRGHRDWEPTNHHFWCAACARMDDVDGVFDELRDVRDGGLLERDQIRLLTPFGPYDQDFDDDDDVATEEGSA
jgi:hypothetical protein